MCESEAALEPLCLSEGRTLFRRESRVALVQMQARRCGKFFKKKAVTGTSVSCVTAFFFIQLVLAVRKQHG